MSDVVGSPGFETVLEAEGHRTTATLRSADRLIRGPLRGVTTSGYEIRNGRTPGGPVWASGRVLATASTGCSRTPHRRAPHRPPPLPVLEETFDLLADAIDAHLDTSLLNHLTAAERLPHRFSGSADAGAMQRRERHRAVDAVGETAGVTAGPPDRRRPFRCRRWGASPTSGPVAGGTVVTVSGTGFAPGEMRMSLVLDGASGSGRCRCRR